MSYISLPIALQFIVPYQARPKIEHLYVRMQRGTQNLRHSLEQGHILESTASKTYVLHMYNCIQELYDIMGLSSFDDSVGGFFGVYDGLLTFDILYADVEKTHVSIIPFTGVIVSNLVT